ncbi:MAG: hypothetical protein JJ863_27985 [Deltaproteobacteria bacterium]|nr:hypothetical protein [Deltaproteobacteria bacterium]
MRLKIIAGNVIAVLLVGLGSFFYVKGQLEQGLGAQIDEQIDNDAQLLQRSWRLSALEFVEQVRDRAETREVRTTFNALDVEARRRSAFERAEGIAAWFQDPARGRGGRPDIVLITDETGRVIARDNDINRMNGTSIVSELPSLRRVLDRGLAVHDVWQKEDDDKLLQVAIAPVRNQEGGLIGALLVGFDISNGLAQREAEVFGHQVAFLREGGIYSSSLEQSEVAALSTYLFQTVGDETAAALASGSTQWTAELAGAEYVGVTASLPETPSVDMGIAILANKTDQMALAETATVILILMAVGLIFVLIYGFLIGTSLIRPIEEIEEGVLTVINGRTDHRIDIESAEFGGLAYRINQLINVFTGVEETDADGRSSGGGAWEGAAAPATTQQDGGGGGGDDEAAAALAAEPEEQYRQRIFDEYVAAKQAAGEDVSNIGKDRFLSRLDKNAENLKKKHGCRMVRFEVQTKGSQVILRPVIIN